MPAPAMIYSNQAHNSITQMTMCKNNNFDTSPFSLSPWKAKNMGRNFEFRTDLALCHGPPIPDGRARHLIILGL